MSACVLPLAPEFQDPPSSANIAPSFTDVVPPIGMIVDGTQDHVPTFTVSVTDMNVGDDLHVRFLADFPPFTANTRTLMRDTPIAHRSDGRPILQDVSETPDCTLDSLAKIPQHQIMAIVADRPFDDTAPPAGMTPDLTKLLDPEGMGKKTIATWTLNLECP
ncbi:MAG TPA: hypothetical protein VHL80_22065 [Polyangia bacterium]|nr:hypothetical protein [Polyangia bacterium]